MGEARIQAAVWEVVHDGTVVPDSGSISYQQVEVAFSVSPDTGSISYQQAEVAFGFTPDSGSISYQQAEVAFTAPIDTGSLSYQQAEVAFTVAPPDTGSLSYQQAEVAFGFTPDSGSISYQQAEVAFRRIPNLDSGSISYQQAEVAFTAPGDTGSISYQQVEVAFSFFSEGKLYGNTTEVAWAFYPNGWPPAPPEPIVESNCGVLIQPNYTINTYGLRTLSCERIKAPGVDQVPFRLGHKTNLGLRRRVYTHVSGAGDPVLYGAINEVAWAYQS